MPTSIYFLLVWAVWCFTDNTVHSTIDFHGQCNSNELCILPALCIPLKNRFAAIPSKSCGLLQLNVCCPLTTTYPPWTTTYPPWTTTYPPWTTTYFQPETGQKTVEPNRWLPNKLREELLEKRTTNVCGKTKNSVQQYIFGGDNIVKNTNKGDWPWMGALFYSNKTSKKSEYGCAGSLISKRWVLTAAHCFTHDPDELEIHFIRFGVVNYKYMKGDDPEPTDIEIEKVIIHKKYYQNGNKNDIALLRLKYAVSFSESVRPICLDHGLKYDDGQKVYIIGWGAKEKNGLSSPALRTSTLKVVNSEQCKNIYEYLTKHSNTIGERTICAGGTNSTTCAGDSGGPLMFFHDGRFYIGGIVSFGNSCSPGDPAVFTRTEYYMDWINENMEEYVEKLI